MSERAFPDLVAEITNTAMATEARRVETILERVIADAGHRCWEIQIGDTRYFRHPIPTTFLGQLRARAIRCSCHRDFLSL